MCEAVTLDSSTVTLSGASKDFLRALPLASSETFIWLRLGCLVDLSLPVSLGWVRKDERWEAGGVGYGWS